MMKIAVWGLGKHAIKNILPALAQSKKLKLYGIYSRNKNVVNKCVKDFNCISWENSDEMLKDPSLDIIYVASPIGIHAEQGTRILKANKHFWCEKPFTSSNKETKELIKLSINKNLTIAEGFMYLYHPQFLWLKNFIQRHKSEEIINIDAKFTIPYTDNPGFRYNPTMGGSTLLDIGTYPLSITLGLIEKEDPEILFKEVKNIPSFEIDMNGHVSLLCPSGTICNLFWGMGLPYRNEIDILAKNSSVFTDKIFSKPQEYTPKFQVRDINGNISIIKSQKCNHFLAMFDHFATLISSEKQATIEKNRILRLAKWTQKIRDY